MDVSDIKIWKNAAVPDGFGECLLVGFEHPQAD